MAGDNDFVWDDSVESVEGGIWHYIGKADKVAIPHIIQGKQVTSYSHMFVGTSVSGVYSDNPNVTDMNGMFWYSQATNLDLTYLDTSSVKNMNKMFFDSKATSINLSNFDTSDVTDMGWMFSGSQTTTLDLSSFDTSNVNSMSQMFWGSKVTKGYARTQEDADRFNTLGSKPEGLTFVVKPKTN